MLNARPVNAFSAQLQNKCSYATRATHRDAAYTRPSRFVIPPQPQPTITSENGARTLRLRRDGVKTLPLPPLMDPIAIEAKERYKHAKSDPEKKRLTAFQRELAKNPFARALATPVRYCSITKARLPAHFLMGFRTVIAAAPSATPIDEDETGQGHVDSRAASRPPSPQLQPTILPSSPTTDSISTGTSSYILNRHDIIAHLNRRDQWSTIVTPRMQDAYARLVGQTRVKVEKVWTWDPEMSDRVRENFRGEVVKELKRAWKDEKSTVLWPLSEYAALVTNEAAEEMTKDMSINALLDIDVVKEEDNGERKAAFSQCPEYDLKEMLGDEDFAQLGIPESLARDYTLAILNDTRSVSLLLALDRLRTFVRPRQIQLAPKRKHNRAGVSRPPG